MPDILLPRFNRLVLLWLTALAPLLVWLASYDSFEMPKQLALKLAAAGIAIFAVGKRISVPPLLLRPLTLVLTLGLVSSLLSPLPLYSLFGEYTSYQGWLNWAALGVLLLVLPSMLDSKRETKRFLSVAIGSCVLVAAYALVQLLGADPVSWRVKGPVIRAFSTAGNPLYLGFLLAPTLPVALGLSAAARSGNARGSWLACYSLLLAGLLASGSRGALAGALAGACALLFLLRSRLPARFVRNVLIASVAVLVLGAALLPRERNPFPLLISRFAAVLRGEDARPRIWAGAGRLIRSAPLLGHGLDTFAALHPPVQDLKLWRFVWQGSPEKAHNELIQLGATAGLLGTGAVIYLILIMARIASRRSRRDPVRAGAAAGLLALGLTSQIGFLTIAPQILILVLAAALAGGLPRRPLPGVLSWPLAAVLVFGLLASLRFASAEVALKAAVREGGAGLDRALGLRAPWSQRLLRAGDALEKLVFGATLGVEADPRHAARIASLRQIYSAALAANPFASHAHSNLARLALREREYEEALAGYRRARELAPYDAYLALEHAQALIGAGDDERAQALLEETAAGHPGFAEPAGTLGYLALKAGNLERAEDMLERALKLDWHGNFGAAAAAAGNLAALYHQDGREGEAARAAGLARQFAASSYGL